MAEGYIKLHRNLLENPVTQEPEMAWLWCVLLLSTNHKDVKKYWNGENIIIKAGQFITGRKKLSKQTGLSENKIYRALKYFETEHQIKQQKNNKFTIITILNWQKYQGNGTTNKQQNEQQIDNKSTTNRQQIDTNKNVKNDKNEKNDKDNNTSPKNPKEFSDDSNEIQLSKLLFEKIHERDPKCKQPDFQKWSIHIDKLIRIDKRSPEIISQVINWCQNDDFWQNNILSTEKLRTQFSQLLLKMDKKKNNEPKSWGALRKAAENLESNSISDIFGSEENHE